MRGLNLCQFIGNLTGAPDVGTTKNGKDYARFAIAVNKSWTDQAGNKQEAVEYVNCSVFGKLAGVVNQHLDKGQAVYVSGELRTTKSEGVDGPKYFTGVVVDQLIILTWKKDGTQAPAAAPASGPSKDDLPF